MISDASSNLHPNFASNKLLQMMLVVYSCVWGWAAYNPIYRFDWFLENILTILVVGILIGTYRRFPLSDVSYILIFIFMVLHTVGGHYTYAEVPFGFWLKEVLELSRNHYDRIVHFGFGLLITYPFYEMIMRLVTRKAIIAALFAFALVSTFSGGFEIIEWIVARVVNPEAGAAYLGTQGDEFDAQKDMALAVVGAFIALFLMMGGMRKNEKVEIAG